MLITFSNTIKSAMAKMFKSAAYKLPNRTPLVMPYMGLGAYPVREENMTFRINRQRIKKAEVDNSLNMTLPAYFL